MTFGEKKTGGGRVPIERIKEMAARGFTEPEMIDILRNEGFNAEQIDKALTLAMRLGITQKGEGKAGTMGLPTYEEFLQRVKREGQTREREERPEPPPQPRETYREPAQSPKENYSRTYPTEDYIRNLVQERVGDVDRRISEIHGQIRDLSSRLEAQQQIFLKIDDVKQDVKELAMKLKSLEKAFKDTLPSIVQSVKVIGDLVHKLKESQNKSENSPTKTKEKKPEEESMYMHKSRPRDQKVKTVDL